jgi:hypothetical protein
MSISRILQHRVEAASSLIFDRTRRAFLGLDALGEE